jgi:Fe-S oxidoreductase
MFNPQTCKQCGVCLMLCPFLDMSKEQAKQAIVPLVENKDPANVLSQCAGCSLCDILCPTNSNPSELRKEIKQAHNRETGVSGLELMSDEVPFSIMSAGLETDKEAKLARLARLTSPQPSEEFFYLGCSLSYIYSDLAQSRLFDKLPAIGGMKYCCGSYVNIHFGEKEARIKGRKLLDELKQLGVKRLITFCPECDHMLGHVYPKLIEGFDIQTRPIADYLLDEHLSGRLTFSHPIDQKVTFHDACGSRKLGSGFHEAPRKLLQALGAELVEMKHNRSKSMCCGVPLVSKNRESFESAAEKRALEAKEAGAQTIVVNCSGCFSLSSKAKKHGLEVYHLIEMVQRALGESPPHRIEEIKNGLIQSIFEKLADDPKSLEQRYVIEDGTIRVV